MNKKVILIVGAAVLVTIIVAAILSALVIAVLTSSTGPGGDVQHMLANGKVTCLQTYGSSESSCKANVEKLENFGGSLADISCCWNIEDEICLAKKYPNGIPAQLENC